MAIVEWPRRSCTTRGWMPCSRASVAQVWRRPCSVSRGQAVAPRPGGGTSRSRRRAGGRRRRAGGRRGRGRRSRGRRAAAPRASGGGALASTATVAGVERDRPPAARRLRLADGHLAADLDDRLDDPQPAGVEVDVGPAQAERLAAAHAGRGEQHPQRVEPIARRPGTRRGTGAGSPRPTRGRRRTSGRPAAGRRRRPGCGRAGPSARRP